MQAPLTIASKIAIVLLAITLLPVPLQAELTVASLFTDHAVLQRDMPVPVWGTADGGAAVTVQFAGQKKATKADSDGRWSVTLDPMSASFEAQTLVVSAAEETREFADVLIGEVWICAGQSNMHMPTDRVPKVKALIPSVKNVRNFNVTQTVRGRWLIQPARSRFLSPTT